jgi:hypothetical protein
MLYTASIMNNKPNIPEAIIPGKNYSVWTDTKINAWLGVAALISCFSDVTFHHVVRQWPLAWQVVIVLAQFFAILLWVRDFTRWISGMDEMHRRITTSTILFAAGATFFFLMLWHRLDRAGLFDAIFPKPKAGGSWDICTVGQGFILMVFFYYLGHAIFNRRYK